jgi:outer membrane lipoprotein-sorting protein
MLALLAVRLASPTINDVLQKGLTDVTFTAHVVKGNQDALAKINRDFGKSFEFSSAKVSMKEPLKVRIESRYEDMTVVMVENDASQVYLIPKIRMKQKRDLTKSPGGRQTFMDFGILTPDLFPAVFSAKFDGADGTTETFDLTFSPSPNYTDTSKQVVTVDVAKKYVIKRLWYGQDGKLKATFNYSDPQLVNGAWIPTDMVVRNREGTVAGETKATDIKVNQGLADSLFGT